MSTVLEGLRKAGRDVRWYVHSIMGDNAYQHYVSHLRVHHPDAPVPTERQFWIDKHAEAERNPKTRCC